MKKFNTSSVLVVALCASCLTRAAAATAQEETKLLRFGGEGHVSLVNADGLASSNVLAEVQKGIEELLLVPVKISNGAWSFANADRFAKDTGAKAAIFIAQDDSLPISLVAMESRWAVVNAKGLSDKAVRREILRVGAVLFGGVYSQYDASVMRPAFSRDDLEEKVGDAYSIDVLLPILNGLSRIGVKQFELMTEADAVEAGYIKKAK